MIAKAIALAILISIGYWHRITTMRSAATGRLFPLLRLAGVELAVIGAAAGLAFVLSGTA